MSIRGGVLVRGTSNSNSRGSAEDRRRRRAYLVERDGWPCAGIVLCWRCGVPLLQDDDPEAPGQAVTVDRIVPGADGGRYTRDNIRAACAGCNSETGGALGGARAQAARSTHARIHAGVRDSVTHESPTVPMVERIDAARTSHASSHAMHAAGPCTGAPPSLQGGPVRTEQDSAA